MSEKDKMILICNGITLDRPLEYKFEQSIFRPANKFNFKMGLTRDDSENQGTSKPEWIRKIFVGDKVEIQINDATRLTGIIDTKNPRGTKEETSVDFSGRGMTGQLLDCSIGQNIHLDYTLRNEATFQLKRFNFKSPYVIDNWNEKKKLSQYNLDKKKSTGGQALTVTGTGADTMFALDSPRKKLQSHPEMKVWDYLEQFTRQDNLLMFESPDGLLVITKPDYKQDVSYKIYRYLPESDKLSTGNPELNNILDGVLDENTHERYSEITVLGQTPITPTINADGTFSYPEYDENNWNIKATAYDEEIKIYRPLIIEDCNIIDTAHAQKRADYEIAHRKINGYLLRYVLESHSLNDNTFQIDTLCEIQDDYLGVYGTFYLTDLEFSRAPAPQGTRTVITLRKMGIL